ncbi:VOC family protein [Bdellovibrio sp. HCB337]|uniref:VOC family protein n=1 Tax=Bdellovibrio sp. HCB337 TaxID=3394358 RepID=UPI0039A5D82B
MQKITPHLWFNKNAEEAVKFYTSIFKNSKVLQTAHYGAAGAEVSGMPQGSVMTIHFQLEGQDFIALNGGPEFQFTHAISLLVNCETQEEVDALWRKLSGEGGESEPCGWVKDKFGVSWQVVPSILEKMVSDKVDPVRAEKVMTAMLKMKKLDIAELERAYNDV